MADTNVTREITASADHWDALRTEAGTDALALIGAMAGATNYAVPGTDVADVANVASAILPAILAKGCDASVAARIALRVAVRAMLRDRGHDLPALSPMGEEITAPTEAVRPMPAARCPRYMGADTTESDILLTALALVRPYLTNRQAEMVRELGQCDGWHADTLPVQRVARNMGEAVSGRRAMAFGAELRQVVAMVRETVANVLTHGTNGHAGIRPAPLAYFTRRLGAAPALPVPVRAGAGTVTPRKAGTSDHGYRWGTGQTTKEADRAGILAGTTADATTAGRPCGVGAGMRHGAGRIAGEGTPTPRPVASRKRKGSGQTGPTVPDRR